MKSADFPSGAHTPFRPPPRARVPRYFTDQLPERAGPDRRHRRSRGRGGDR
jgi:hypothetical protein